MGNNKYKLVVFDFDGVIADTVSSWVWVHDYFSVNNDASLELYLQDKIDDLEFMRRDIALWRAKKPDISITDLEEILSSVPIMKGTLETITTLKEKAIDLLKSNNLDFVVGNTISGFNKDENEIWIIDKKGNSSYKKGKKEILTNYILDTIKK